MDGAGPQDIEARRKTNKTFMECLVKVQHTRPEALIWLKARVDFKICQVILSDDKYSGIKEHAESTLGFQNPGQVHSKKYR